ncbi:chitobiase/beta-hexosaminidase C-terminal domain-containing protein [Clostridium perfringens]|nr:chitobiase/beta-hexosaminidase C-terminal domain-containing protein [Clostridium perfringens]
MIKFERKKNNNLTIVNIYNFIRKTVYPSGEFVEDDFQTVVQEIELIKQYGFPATYALKHDALMDERFTNLIKSSVDEYDEVGAWWEITEELARKAGVKWKGETPIDDHVHIGYSLGYSPEDRIKMADVYMEDFKNIFGHYPKTVGSWVIDIRTLSYLKEKYGVIGGAICRDQIGTDGFTLWGGYFNQAYYPSKLNEYIPAQSEEMQLDLPLFRLLGPDPIYNFEEGLRPELKGVHTLEPAWIIGQSKEWVDWFFECLTDEDALGFSYAQVGQENTFLWNTMYKGYEVQIEHIYNLEKMNKVRVETLAESALWYKKKYKLTPPTTFGAKKDWNTYNMKTLWYNSRFYRSSFLFENNVLSIRDIHLFNENYKSRYYESSLDSTESIFDALPLMRPHYWKDEINERPEISFVKAKRIGVYEKVEGKYLNFKSIGEDKYEILWQLHEDEKIKILCEEDKIKINFNVKSTEKYMICLNTLPVLKELNLNTILCEHNNFKYKVSLIKGKFTIDEDFKILITSDDGEVVIDLNTTNKIAKEKEFFNEEYLKNREQIDEYIPEYKRYDKSNKVKLRAFRPIVNIDTLLVNKPFTKEILLGKKDKKGEIRYTLDGSEPNENSILYKEPIVVNDRAFIKAKVFKEGYKPSNTIESRIYVTLPIADIKGLTNPTNHYMYNKNGVYDLIDGQKGSLHYTDGRWLGYTEDMEVIVDLGEIKDIKEVMVGFLQDTRAWIYYPKFVEFYSSIDGKEFYLLEREEKDSEEKREEVGKKDIVARKDSKARYIKIFAKNEEVCPQWSIMPGEGPTFMFVDQVTVL